MNQYFISSVGERAAKGQQLSTQGHYAIGIELTSGHIRMLAVDLLVRRLGAKTVAIPFQANDEYALRLTRAIEDFIDEEGLSRQRLLGVGVTVPGIVDAGRTHITDAPTIQVKQMAAADLIGHIPYPVWLENDANAGGYAEWWNRAGVADMAYLSVGRGVGGAILIAGSTYLGTHTRSGEFGHMCIHPGGKICECGQRGCLEAYCSTGRLSDALGISLEEFFSGMEGGNGEYRSLWNDYLDNLAIGVRNIHVILDCGIVIGGKLSQFLARHFAEMESRLRKLDAGYLREPYLSICRYRSHSTEIGAALYFIDKFIKEH